MRGRIPRKQDLSRMILGILQSTAFLTTSAFSYSAYLCWLRHTFGGFNIFTASYIPAFMSSLTAILVERPSRRGLLTMYVANVATETLWRMGVSRKMVRGVSNGQVLIFGVATSFLTYYFRSGWHLDGKDSVYDIVRFIIGKDEEGGEKEVKEKPEEKKPRPLGFMSRYLVIQKFIKAYKQSIDKLKALPKHEKCSHESSCAHYALSKGTKLFGIGLGVQVALKLVMNIQKIVASPKKLKTVFWTKDTLKIGAFLGGFSFIYRVSKQKSNQIEKAINLQLRFSLLPAYCVIRPTTINPSTRSQLQCLPALHFYHIPTRLLLCTSCGRLCRSPTTC